MAAETETSVPEEEHAQAADGTAASLRLDKWLWYARFFKSRARAAELCAARKIRRNRVPVEKPHQPVKPGDVLTFPQGPFIRVVRIVALAERRGPTSEARRLYEDLAPPASGQAAAPEGAEPVARQGSGRQPAEG